MSVRFLIDLECVFSVIAEKNYNEYFSWLITMDNNVFKKDFCKYIPFSTYSFT